MADAGVLIIGGAGYFGARLAEALAADGPVTVTYRSRPVARAAWLTSGTIQAVQYDSARDSMLPVKEAFRTVINLAMPGANEAGTDPEGSRALSTKTIDAALALLEEGRAESIIHFSTFHVYGSSGAPDYIESTNPSPTHPYGEVHAMVEKRIAAHQCCNQVVVLRPTNMVGAPAHADLGFQAGLIFLDLCRQAVAGHMVLRNDGKSFRDIIPFSDAIEAVRLVADEPSLRGKTMNLGAGKALRLDVLAEAIAAGAREPVDILYGDGTDAYRKEFHVSIDRFHASGWSPENDLSSEIARTLDFFYEQYAAL